MFVFPNHAKNLTASHKTARVQICVVVISYQHINAPYLPQNVISKLNTVASVIDGRESNENLR